MAEAQPCFEEPQNDKNLTIQKLLQLRANCKSDMECSNILIEKYNFNANNRDSLRRKISKCCEKVKLLKKNKSKKLSLGDYLSSEFVLTDKSESIAGSFENERQQELC